MTELCIKNLMSSVPLNFARGYRFKNSNYEEFEVKYSILFIIKLRVQ